jgi:hypothetical protein
MLGNADGGRLRFDLAGALVDATIEVLDAGGEPGGESDEEDRFEGDRQITLADLNAMFALSLGEGSSLPLNRFEIPLDERNAAIEEVAGFLVGEWDLIDVIMSVATTWSCLASSAEGTATMTSDSGIGLYEFTVDDGVYFFTHAELDVDEPRWWFAHAVYDAHTRVDAAEAGRATIGARDVE